MANSPTMIGEADVRRGIETLKSRCLAWERDESLRLHDWKVYYALDTDIISMYLDPHGHPLYGQVFEGFPEIDSSLTWLLSDYLFESDSKFSKKVSDYRPSYFIIPPHDEELRRIILAIARHVEQAVSAAVADKIYSPLSKVFRAFSISKDSNKFAADLQEHVPTLIALFNAIGGYATQHDRFARLDPGDILNLWNARDSDGTYLVKVSETEVQEAISEQIPTWFGLLARYRSERKSASTLLTDAKVLATLEYLNAKLAKNKRVIMLITGSPSLFKAATQRFVMRDNAGLASFASLYLRHPQWVMSDIHFFELMEADIDLGAWFGMLFPGKKKVDYLSASRAIGSEELKKIPQQWNTLIKILAAKKYGGSLKVAANKTSKINGVPAALVHHLTKLVESGDWSREALQKLFEKQVTTSLSQLYFSSTWIGLLASASLSKETSKRMPALRFDPPFQAFNEHYLQILSLLATTSEPRSDLIVQIKSMHQEMKERDPSLYHSHVIHAAAYAAKALWEPTLTLCKIAIRIAEELPKSTTERRRGREAAYLAAIASRRNAKNLASLNESSRFLDLAEKLQSTGEPYDLRFDSERVAIKSREVYFRYFVDRDTHVIDEVEGIIYRLLELISFASAARSETNTSENSNVAAEVATWVYRQCCTNLFNLALIIANEKEAIPEESKICSLAREFATSLDRDLELGDQHARLVTHMASRCLCEPSAGAAVHSPDLESLISSSIIAMPYDVGRLKMFTDLLRRNRENAS